MVGTGLATATTGGTVAAELPDSADLGGRAVCPFRTSARPPASSTAAIAATTTDHRRRGRLGEGGGVTAPGGAGRETPRGDGGRDCAAVSGRAGAEPDAPVRTRARPPT